MLRAVACPNCRVELDIPEELLGQAVRCSSCATTFTPARSRPDERRPSRDASPDDNGDDDGRPRRRPEPRKSGGSGLLTVVGLLLAGTFGVCCLGCAGLAVVGVKADNPALEVYRSPDGQFEAYFPGPPTATENELNDQITLKGVAHTRHLMGQEFDTCTVQFYDLPKAPAGDAARDKVLQSTADAYIAGQADMGKSKVMKMTAQGYPALEVTMEGDDPQVTLFARIILADKRVYVVSYDGHGLVPESQRLANFWAKFRVLKSADAAPEKAADIDKPAAKPKVRAKDR